MERTVAELSSQRGLAAVLRDVLDLCKPGISTFVVFSSAMALWLAPQPVGWARAGAFLFATAMLVGGANILNCFLERESDGRMRRTRNRPLPAGRLDPWGALGLGLFLAALSLPLLVLVAGWLTAGLGLMALLSYVAVYTPLKRITPRALEVGTLPGALPMLLGWSAATGGLAPLAWALFGLLVFWQLPHFIAIAIYLKDDYERGGILVLPGVHGNAAARRWLVVYTAGLLAVSTLPHFLGATHPAYLVTALVAGGIFLALALQGLVRGGGAAWARRVFLYSLLYLPWVLITLLVAAS